MAEVPTMKIWSILEGCNSDIQWNYLSGGKWELVEGWWLCDLVRWLLGGACQRRRPGKATGGVPWSMTWRWWPGVVTLRWQRPALEKVIHSAVRRMTVWSMLSVCLLGSDILGGWGCWCVCCASWNRQKTGQWRRKPKPVRIYSMKADQYSDWAIRKSVSLTYMLYEEKPMQKMSVRPGERDIENTVSESSEEDEKRGNRRDGKVMMNNLTVKERLLSTALFLNHANDDRLYFWRIGDLLWRMTNMVEEGDAVTSGEEGYWEKAEEGEWLLTLDELPGDYCGLELHSVWPCDGEATITIEGWGGADLVYMLRWRLSEGGTTPGVIYASWNYDYWVLLPGLQWRNSGRKRRWYLYGDEGETECLWKECVL